MDAATISEEKQVIETECGRLGVLICADSWHQDLYDRLQNPDVIAVPAWIYPAESWVKQWGGYITTPIPEGVDVKDVNKLTECDAWHKYSVPTRMKITSAKVGILSFSNGSMWKDTLGGTSAIYVGGKEYITQHYRQNQDCLCIMASI